MRWFDAGALGRRAKCRTRNRRNGEPVRQPNRRAELVVRRGAPLPVMRNGKEPWQDILENDEMNAHPNRDVSEGGRAVHELAEMREPLAQRAVWVIAGGKWVEGAIRLAVRGNGNRGWALFRQCNTGRNMRRSNERVMNMGLDDQCLNRQGHEGDQHYCELLEGRQAHRGRPGTASIQHPSTMAVLGHPSPEHHRVNL